MSVIDVNVVIWFLKNNIACIVKKVMQFVKMMKRGFITAMNA